jgi:putative MFS transporter
MEDYYILGTGALLPTVAEFYHASVAETSVYLLSIVFFGAFFGAVVLGRLSDRIGRRTIIVYNLTITSVMYLISPFSPNLQIMGVTRFIAGVGTGAEIPLMIALLGEFFPAKYRGKASARSRMISYTGPAAFAALAYVIVPTHVLLYGWQWMFIIGGLGLLVVLPLRFMIPESLRWLEMKGRTEECEKELSRIEAIAIREKGQLPEPEIVAEIPAVERSNVRELFGKSYRKRTVMLWIMQFLQTGFSYAILTLGTAVLVSKGFTIVRSLGYQAVILAMPPIGFAVNSLIADSIRFDRKWQLASGFGLFGALGLLFGLSAAPLEAVVTGAAMTFCNAALYSSAMYTYPAELYPTRLRGTGASWQYSLSRIGNTLWLTLLPLVLVWYGGLAMLTVTACLAWTAALDIAILGPKASQTRLEVLSK